MDWTTALAVFGAVTGAGSFGWQLWSHRLTGARIQLVVTRTVRDDGCWWIEATASNVGRMDVAVTGYLVWAEAPGLWLRKARWRTRVIMRHGVRVSRQSLSVPRPHVYFTSPVRFDDGDYHLELPLVLGAGTSTPLPTVGLHPLRHTRRRPRVAVFLATGEVARAYAEDYSTLSSIEYGPETTDWRIHIGRGTSG